MGRALLNARRSFVTPTTCNFVGQRSFVTLLRDVRSTPKSVASLASPLRDVSLSASRSQDHTSPSETYGGVSWTLIARQDVSVTERDDHKMMPKMHFGSTITAIPSSLDMYDTVAAGKSNRLDDESMMNYC